MPIGEYVRSAVASLPLLAKFAIGIVLIAVVPPLSRRGRLPPVVGLLVSGVVFGPHVLDVFRDQQSMAPFLGDLGALLLMFFAGLEMDLTLFRQKALRAVAFGLATTTIPLLLGTAAALWLGYGTVTAIVVGSLLASHTLLGSPIVRQLGLANLEPIVVTFGATVLSDTLSLLVFAICALVYVSGFSASALAVQIIEIIVFIPLVLFGLGRLGARLLKKMENDEETYFVLLLCILAVAALLAQFVNLPGIVGTFLAGLAVNAAVHDKPAKTKLEFLGNSLFIPIFFMTTGFLIDPLALARSLIDDFPAVAMIVATLLGGKWIAAELTGRAFGYTSVARRTVWSLTLPQVAATLAATLVAYRTLDSAGQRLLDTRMLNVVLVLVLTTSILGPVLTQRWASLLRESLSTPKTLGGTDH